MAEPHLTELRLIAQQWMLHSDNFGSIVCKHFFSGAAAYKDNQIFMSLSPVGLALKLPEAECAALIANGATELQYFSNSPIKKGYVVLPTALVEDHAVLMGWVKRSIEHSAH